MLAVTGRAMARVPGRLSHVVPGRPYAFAVVPEYAQRVFVGMPALKQRVEGKFCDFVLGGEFTCEVEERHAAEGTVLRARNVEQLPGGRPFLSAVDDWNPAKKQPYVPLRERRLRPYSAEERARHLAENEAAVDRLMAAVEAFSAAEAAKSS